MTSKTPSEKPPAQVAGVQGFSAFESKPTEPRLIDWQHLFSLPPFQMYAVERAGKSAADVMSWMPDWLRSHEGTHQALYDDYCQWHRDKGCWPDETPLGELRG